jgi:hypothetical protein
MIIRRFIDSIKGRCPTRAYTLAGILYIHKDMLGMYIVKGRVSRSM